MNCRRLLPLALLLPHAPALAQEARLARLAGIVTDAASEPVPNCAVCVEVDGLRVAQARTDGTGSFLFGRVPSQRAVVRATEPRAAGAVAIDLTGLQQGFVRVPLYPTRTLRGRVRAPGGDAIAGAWILASPVDSGDFGVIDAIATSDAEGRYELPNVLIGPVRMRAWREGHGLFEANVDGADDLALDCELGDEIAREVVFLLRGAMPGQLAAARLRLVAQDKADVPTRLPPPLCDLRADAEGRCVVRGWSADDRLVARFELPGFAVVPPADFAPRGPRRWTTTFDLRPASHIVGVLRDERGEALVDQRLLGRPFHDDDILGVAVSGRTGVDGSFRLASPVAPGEQFVLSLAARDHALVQAEGRDAGLLSCHLGRHDEAASHDLVARRCGVARLRVVDAQSQPVRGATVTMLQGGAGSRPVYVFQRGAVRRQAGTAADGSVEFRGVDLGEAGTLRFDIVAAQGATTVECAIGNGNDVDLGAVELKPTAPLAGIVLDADGKPIAGARVRLLAHDEGMTQHAALTARDGRFAFAGLQPGQYSYGAMRGADTVLMRKTVDLPADGVKDLELRVK